jgi:hypothetical protein
MKPKLKRDVDAFHRKAMREQEIEAGMYNKPAHQVHKGKKDYSRKKQKKNWKREGGND